MRGVYEQLGEGACIEFFAYVFNASLHYYQSHMLQWCARKTYVIAIHNHAVEYRDFQNSGEGVQKLIWTHL